MQAHELKTEPKFFERVLQGHKKFELRFNDRGYRLGDLLILREFDTVDGYTSRTLVASVKYLTDYKRALRPGYVAMSLSRPRGIIWEAAADMLERVNGKSGSFPWCEQGHTQMECCCVPGL